MVPVVRSGGAAKAPSAIRKDQGRLSRMSRHARLRSRRALRAEYSGTMPVISLTSSWKVTGTRCGPHSPMTSTLTTEVDRLAAPAASAPVASTTHFNCTEVTGPRVGLVGSTRCVPFVAPTTKSIHFNPHSLAYNTSPPAVGLVTTLYEAGPAWPFGASASRLPPTLIGYPSRF